MPTANYDVSELTRFRIARALRASYNHAKAYVAAGLSVQPEQAPYSTNETYHERKHGGAARIIDGVEKIGTCCGDE
jgi:hypothetical protein